MKKILYSSLLLSANMQFTFTQLSAQLSNPFCATDKIHLNSMKNDDEYRKQFEQTANYLRNLSILNYKTVTTGSGNEYHVPVVVHVIHTGGTIGSNYNPTDSAILAFIQHINEGFSNSYDNTSISGMFNSINIPIRFYLAQRDELNACSATTGINRINYASNSTYNTNGVGSPGITDASLKSIIHWNELDYYNIYIVNKIDGVDGYCSPCTFTAGYALFPLLGGNKLDGMVVLAHEVNQSSEVFIHEMGHGFNLIHPFDGGNQTTCPSNSVCLSDNDQICDTDPIQLDFTCNPTGTNPCTGLNWSNSTIQYNYMSYFGCQDRFTAGQASRVNDVINFIRTGYKNSAGGDAPPTQLPASITAPTYTTANIGNTFEMGPTRVVFNTIDYPSKGYSYEGAGSVYYVDHTCNQSTPLLIGSTYTVSVNTIINPQKVKVYIDFNNDGTFGTAAPELVYEHAGTQANETHTGNVIIPSTGVISNVPLRMRVIADFSNNITPTMQLLYGQAEDYTITLNSLPLPVMWRDFSAVLMQNNYVDLRWSTEMEYKNNYFELERSIDGIHYQSLARIKGNNEKYSPSFYSFIDKAPQNGINFYRIKQVDINNKENYSEIESISVHEPTFTIEVRPNPLTEYLQIELHAKPQDRYTMSILDISGRIVLRESGFCSTSFLMKQVDMQHQPAGLYLLSIRCGDESKMIKLIKTD